jgi:hypothetical protein
MPMKAIRLTEANGDKRQRTRKSAISSTAKGRAWLRSVSTCANERFEVIRNRAAVVAKMYLEAIAGLGKRRIAARLTRAGILTFSGKEGWHHSSVGKILSDEAVLGLFQPHRNIDGTRVPYGPPIPHFPAIIDEETFWRAQDAINRRRKGAAGRKGPAETNLFAGIGTCGECRVGKLCLIDKGKYLVCRRASNRLRLCRNYARFPYELLETRLLAQPGIVAVLAPERLERSTDHAARIAELEAKLTRVQSDRKQFIAAFHDDDDPMLVEEIRRLGVEVKQVAAELAEARKVAKATEHADRRDYAEQLFDALQQLGSDDLDIREIARAKLAQAFRSTIDAITLHRDGHLIAKIKRPNGFIDEYEFTPKGLVRMSTIFPDGKVLRVDAAVLDAALAPDLAGLDERMRELFLDRSEFALKLASPENPNRHLFGNKRMPLGEEEFLEKALLIDQVVARLAIRQVGEREYEAILIPR